CGSGGLSCARSSSFSGAGPGGVKSSHKPMLRHSSAGTLRPVKMISSARPWPTIRGNRTVPPSISGTPQRRQKTGEDPLPPHRGKTPPRADPPPPGTCRAFDRGDAGFLKLKPRRPRRPTGNVTAITAWLGGRDIELSERIIRVERADI